MKHLLIDLDSKIPNLALMQLSTWLKAKGQAVSLRIPNDPNRVWISCIFTWNAPKAWGLAAFWKAAGADVQVGGTGVDFVQNGDLRLVKIRDSRLPGGASKLAPDYSLYPDDDRAVGFTSRGCNRACEFCVVPQKEGRISGYWAIADWAAEREKVLLLDNDLPLSPHHDAVLKEAIDGGYRLSITQGYDIRCVARGDVSHEGLTMLAENKPWDMKFNKRRLYIAWDYVGIEPYVRQGIERLFDYGFRPVDLMAYILCGFNTTPKEDFHRVQVLWDEYNIDPFVMVYNNRRDDPHLRAFARWVNRRFHKVTSWDEYRSGLRYAVDSQS